MSRAGLKGFHISEVLEAIVIEAFYEMRVNSSGIERYRQRISQPDYKDKEAVTPNSVLCVTGGLTLARWGGEVILGPSLISGASRRLGFPQGTVGFQRIAAVC
ncbi:hypothetical protein F5888DRAFT_1634868 [Russula emetica]|nr:hypothetical protein F5888DRAFT_1634868 [Russula emetica]